MLQPNDERLAKYEAKHEAERDPEQVALIVSGVAALAQHYTGATLRRQVNPSIEVRRSSIHEGA